MSPEERLELIYNAALEAKAKQEELIGLLGSIMWLARDLSGPSAFNDEEIEALVKDKEALRYRRGPLRYKVLDNVGQLIAMTRTKWTGHLLAKALTRADVGLVPFHVEDMDGNELESDEEE